MADYVYFVVRRMQRTPLAAVIDSLPTGFLNVRASSRLLT